MSDFSAFGATKVTAESDLWIVTMDRPDVLNALNEAAHRELQEAFDAFQADEQATVAILTGSGAAFCSGHDYAGLNGAPVPRLPEGGFGGLTRRSWNRKPIIAAVNGDALDEGFELVLACDLVVANEDTRFAMQQGLWARAPVEGGAQRLVRQIPLKKAMAALLTGAPISAAEGVLLGFVNDITGFDQVLPLARQWADRIRKFSRQSVLAIQEAAMRGLSEPSLEAALHAKYGEVEKLLGSPEYESSAARILENRDSPSRR